MNRGTDVNDSNGDLLAEVEALRAEVEALRAENDRLRGLLGLGERRNDGHVHAWAPTLLTERTDLPSVHASSLDADKLALLWSLFGARADIYARRWESVSSGKSGWSHHAGERHADLDIDIEDHQVLLTRPARQQTDTPTTSNLPPEPAETSRKGAFHQLRTNRWPACVRTIRSPTDFQVPVSPRSGDPSFGSRPLGSASTRRNKMEGYVAKRRDRFDAVVYEGRDPVTGNKVRR